jgi:hypothetical protein
MGIRERQWWADWYDRIRPMLWRGTLDSPLIGNEPSKLESPFDSKHVGYYKEEWEARHRRKVTLGISIALVILLIVLLGFILMNGFLLRVLSE